MADASSPPRPKSYRLGSLQNFLPLSSYDSALSTRGQKLASIIRSRSSANIKDLPALARQRPTTPDMREGDESGGDGEGGENGGFSGSSPVKSKLGRIARRMSGFSDGGDVLMTPQMRSMRLIGNSNPRYQWEKYYKSEEELKKMKKPIRQYYERNNSLISSYLYIDRLLDSSLPHDLLQEYNHDHGKDAHIPHTIEEEPSSPEHERHPSVEQNGHSDTVKVKRTPKALYKLPNENTPLLGDDVEDGPRAYDLQGGDDEEDDSNSGSRVVIVAIYINFAANIILLAGKIAVIVLTSSLSVLASLVDAALDFLSTIIVWTTTWLISHQDQYSYPVGRRRLEPIGVLVFSVIMITSFFQVFLECFNRLTGPDHSIVRLTIPAIAIMASTVVIKGLCWFWCRLIKNSSVQALAQDAETDGDKLNVEVDVVLDENMTLRDSHDLGESLQYVLESVPNVDRAFVHLDYAGWNLPSHMQQQAE
ncbi:hypothetical protein P7C71_g6326, partial [Lecanoromycetidae sp. Uapishka_2]